MKLTALFMTAVVFCIFIGCGSNTNPETSGESSGPDVQQSDDQREKLEKPPKSKLTAENYLRIKEGMRRDEVLLILGQPTESDFEDQDARLQKAFDAPARAREFVVNSVYVHETWKSTENFQGIPLRTIRVTFQWIPNEPGSVLGSWKIVRKSQAGLK